MLWDIDQIEAILRDAARQGHALSYSEMLLALGYRFTRPKMRALCKAMAEVDARALARGEPELAVLVVRQSDGLPGQGWWTGRTDGYHGPWEGPRAQTHIKMIQDKAFTYWQKAPQKSRAQGRKSR